MAKCARKWPSVLVQVSTPSSVGQGAEGKDARVVQDRDKRRPQEVVALGVPGHPLG